MLTQDLVVDGHGTGDHAWWVIWCLSDAEEPGAVREIDMKLDDARFFQDTCAFLWAQLAIGDVVDQSGFAVLRDADSEMGTHTPIELFQIAEIEFVCGHTP
jgi:hypothetical protein